MPYLFATAISTHQTGTPMMRPLFFEFPEDRNSWMVDEAYMLGENIYVAPVFRGSDLDSVGSGGYSTTTPPFAPENSGSIQKESTVDEKASVEVYIPHGDWFSLLTGEFFTGPSWSIQHHGYDSVPLFLRPGSAIVLSGGAMVDFYFDKDSAWKLKDLNESTEGERAWKCDGEWKARGAEYDYASRVTVLVNASRPPQHGASLDLKVIIPDSRDENLGESSAVLRIRETKNGRICAEVVSGEVKEEWRLQVVRKGHGAQNVSGRGQKLEI